MAAPEITVEAFFDFPFNPDSFTLDDPVRGELDNVTYQLYSATEVDITPETMTGTIRRGTSGQLFPDADSGSAQVVLNNLDRTFDPIHASSPYFGNIIPGRRVRVRALDYTIFDGRVEDWDLSYDISGMSTAVAKLTDGLSILARQQFDDWTATAAQTAGVRLDAVLDRDEVQWPANRDLDTGVSTLQADVVAWGTNVLDYCRLVSKSDLGLLFMSRDGVLTFRDRHANLNPTADVTFSDGSVVEGIGYKRIDVSYGSEQLFNRVGVTRTGGASQTVIDLDAQLSYGVRSYTAPTLLLDSNAQALDMANFLLGQFTDPQYRVATLEVELAKLTDAEQESMLQLDISSVVRVRFTPNDVGAEVDRYCIVYGVDHTLAPMSHLMTLHLGDADRRSTFTLDASVFGRLDSNSLAF